VRTRYTVSAFCGSAGCPARRHGSRTEQAVIQEGQGFSTLAENKLSDLAQLGEALDALAQLRQFGQGRLGSTATVKETIDLVRDVTQRAELR